MRKRLIELQKVYIRRIFKREIDFIFMELEDVRTEDNNPDFIGDQ
jgi:hypothetical protein